MKKMSHVLEEPSDRHFSVNCSITARNLRKSDLGGVVFGCTHDTKEECYSKKLFGLPASHNAYIKNIHPGTPLFLFNYSDRKLHGIFEATSSGELGIDPYAWTGDQSKYTSYPAQVRVKFVKECKPLCENEFKPIIEKNYYKPRLFWFELDLDQTSGLIDMFSTSPISTNKRRLATNEYGGNKILRVGSEATVLQPTLNRNPSVDDVEVGEEYYLKEPQAKWSSLFKT